MHRSLPREIDPFRLAHNGLRLEGQIPLSIMKRLAPSLQHTDGLVDVKMRFDIDGMTTPFMEGQIKASLVLTCERCMAPVTIDVDIHCLLALIKHERKIDTLGDQYDLWIIDGDEPITSASVVEDELILALPLVPKHDYQCLPEEVWHSGEEEKNEDVDKPPSPFAVLSSLKTKK